MRRILHLLRWMLLRIGTVLGRFNTFLLLSLSFFLILFPLSLLVRLARRLRGSRPRPGWQSRPPLPPDHYRRQF